MQDAASSSWKASIACTNSPWQCLHAASVTRRFGAVMRIGSWKVSMVK